MELAFTSVILKGQTWIQAEIGVFAVIKSWEKT